MDTGVSTVPVPIRLRVVSNRFVAEMSDGTVVEDFGAFPALQDGAPIESVVAANREAIEAILSDDMTDDEREAALAAVVASIHAVVDADNLRVSAIEARLSANEAVLAAHALALTNLGAASSANAVAIAAAQNAIGLLQAAVTALQGATGNNAAAIAAAQAAITALQAKVVSQDGRLDSISAIVASLSAAVTADEALAAAQGADIATLRGQRTTDAAAIAATQTAITALQGQGAAASAAITALQGLRTTDAAAIAANGVAIGALQAAQTADEGTLAAQGASIGALQARALVDENLIAANGLSIASNTTRLAALEAGAPRVYGPPRPVVPYVDIAVVVASYAVVRAAQGRTYAFSLVNPSVANALAISADGMLSTVADGFAGVAGGSTITVTVRATDNLGGMFDYAVTVEKSALTGAPVRVLLGAERLSTNGTWDKASREVSYPGFTEALFACIGAGAGGWQSNTAFGSGGYGGAPGTVAQRLVAKTDIPSSFTYTIGAGGAGLVQAVTNFTICNAGGTTTANLSPVLRAVGGRGGSINASNSAVSTSPVSSTPPVTPPSNSLASTANRALGDAYPSFGPGAGGAGASGGGNSGTFYAGGNGGDGGYDQGANACAGGIANTTTFQPAGQSSNVPGRYGGGGAGAMGADGSTAPQNNGWVHAGAGGFPGGGGGGGASVSYSAQRPGNSGSGGAGALDVFYYKWVLA